MKLGQVVWVVKMLYTQPFVSMDCLDGVKKGGRTLLFSCSGPIDIGSKPESSGRQVMKTLQALVSPTL